MSHTKQTKKDGRTGEKLRRKPYEKELARLQGELVRLQEWVVRGEPRFASSSKAVTPPGRAE